MLDSDRTILKEEAQKLGVVLSGAQTEQFATFHALLSMWNKRIDLTAVPESEYLERHFLDSLILAPLILRENNPRCRIIDIGTGAGFPGIPLAISFPQFQFVLVDSLQKRVVFLKAVVAALNLSNVIALHGRGELLAHKYELREKFDIATARAVANLSVLTGLVAPFVRIGGLFIAPKGASAALELGEASLVLAQFGVEQEKVPAQDDALNLLAFRKKTATPHTLPKRNFKK